MCKTYENEDRGYPEIETSYYTLRIQKFHILSLFFPQLQNLLKPIYDLTRKGRVFHLGTEQHEAFNEIKRWLQKPQVLYIPYNKKIFYLYFDISKFATGRVLYHIQNGQPKLKPYASKRLPAAAKNYSITKLELCGLAINIASFSQLLKRVECDAVVDHLALMHIMNSKCYIRQCLLVLNIVLDFFKCLGFNMHYISLYGALNLTQLLIFRFSSLCTLRWHN